MDGDTFMANEKIREIPLKNYFILGFILLISVLIVCFFYMWFDSYNEAKLNSPIASWIFFGIVTIMFGIDINIDTSYRP